MMEITEKVLRIAYEAIKKGPIGRGCDPYCPMCALANACYHVAERDLEIRVPAGLHSKGYTWTVEQEARLYLASAGFIDARMLVTESIQIVSKGERHPYVFVEQDKSENVLLAALALHAGLPVSLSVLQP